MLVLWNEILLAIKPRETVGVYETPNEWDKMLSTHIVGNTGAPNSVSIRIEGTS